MIVLVAGSRDADPARHLEEICTAMRWIGRQREGRHSLLHGAARGVDSLAQTVAVYLGWIIEPVPAEWQSGRYAGFARNQAMVDRKPDVCLAFPALPVNFERSGTMDCVNRAINAGIPTLVFPITV